MNVLPKVLTLPPETRTGLGAAREMLNVCAPFGGRGMLVCGQSLQQSGKLDVMRGAVTDDIDVRVWAHPGGEPTLEQLETLRSAARAYAPDWIAAVGGGSVIDIAKAGAGLLYAPQQAQAYHDGASIPPSSVPFVVAPTTAGTGSEATIVSVLTNSDTGVKKSIRHPSFMARLVLLDPDLLDGCPDAVVAASGMDALTQAIESYCSAGASWITDRLALKATALIHGSIEAVFSGDAAKRGDLLTGSYLAGIALSNARLGIVHGLAHPLGARFHVPHGLACAVCLPRALAFNRDAIPEKYAKLSETVGMDIQDYAQVMLTRLRLQSPFAGESLEDKEALIAETLASGSTKANPREVTGDDVEMLLQRLFAPSHAAPENCT